MALCGYCGLEMLEVDDCSANRTIVYPDGTELDAIPYNPDYGGEKQKCHCGIGRGKYHHPGCDMERCPECGGQLISCGCLDTEDEEDE